MVSTVSSGTSQPLTLLGIKVSKFSSPYNPASCFLGNEALYYCLPPFLAHQGLDKVDSGLANWCTSGPLTTVMGVSPGTSAGSSSEVPHAAGVAKLVGYTAGNSRLRGEAMSVNQANTDESRDWG